MLQAKSHTGDFGFRDGRLVATAPGPHRAIWFSTNDFIDPSIGQPLHVLKKGVKDHKNDPTTLLAIVELIE